MRKILALFLMVALFTSGVNAQHIKSSKMPPIIIKDFNVRFPNVSKVKWRKIESLYFASFMLDGKGIDVTYQSTGEWVETLSEISINDLPTEVVTGVHNLFTAATIKAAAKVEQSTKEILYIVQLRFKGRKAEMTLDAKGNQVS
jgi:hypothetical protein